MAMSRIGTFLRGAGALLQPWPGLCCGVMALSAGCWWTAQASTTELAHMLAGDALMLLRLVCLGSLLTWPLLALSARARRLWQGLLGTLCLLALAALDVYFSVAGVPLGADLWAYSWQEVRTTVAGAQVAVPLATVLALLTGLIVLWGSLWWFGRQVQWSARVAVGVLGLCLAGSLLLPATLAGASVLATNKLRFFVSDCLEQLYPASGAGSPDFPFEHADTTPDTLGPLMALDAARPPNLVLIVVEGLGRSFSGPGARLGSFTPFLDELARKSLYWENFLATQGRTFAVLPSVLGSLPFGPYGEQPIANDNLLNLLQSHGYSLRYVSGSNLSFDHQGAFLQASGVDRFWSEADYTRPERKVSEWGYPDGELVQALLQQPVPPSPSVTVVQTMSMHTPFALPQAETYRHKVEARLSVLGVSPAQRETYRKHQDIYASILYTDEALKQLFDSVSTRPQWQNTVFVITGDHRLPELPMATRIERYHVPLIVYTPMLRQARSIKAVSSHFDIAPALLAMLSNRYGLALPRRVHWMGTGLDVHPQWRNLHAVPLKQTRTELSDYVAGEYYLAQDKLFSLQDGLVTAPEDNAVVGQELRSALAGFKSGLPALVRQGRLVPEAAARERIAYTEAGRILSPTQGVRQIEGVVVSGVQGRFDAEGQLNAQALFSLQGQQASPVFVPLLVLTDANGQELGEASGQALRLQPGQSQPVSLSLKLANLPEGRYYLSMVVSHPETGRPIGKGQYHVPVAR